jgi:cytochrome c oxidase cbb3-type subunit 3
VRLTALALVILILAGAAVWDRRHRLAEALLTTEPSQILRNTALLARAVRLGRPLYLQHCAGCHGSALRGDPARGVPDLAKNAWLYGNDPVDVERTILYGIRSGHPKSRNVTDMPALVRSGQITAADARDAVEYLQALAGRPHDDTAAVRGRAVYYNNGNCYDCHANDARGVADYGTPALTGPIYLYGGDRATLYQSILNGRHGRCPAWINVLSPLQIRALALYLVAGHYAALAVNQAALGGNSAALAGNHAAGRGNHAAGGGNSAALAGN